MELKELIKIVMKQAEEKGFGTKTDEVNVPEKIALIHSEISEAYESYRKKDSENFKQELGDAVQRILHLCGIFDIDLEKEILDKIEKNKKRKWDWKELNERHN